MYEANRSALNDTQLQKVAPAIFADHPKTTTSDRYAFIPTIDVVNALREHGWFPVSVKNTRVRHSGNKEYAPHLLRFSRMDRSIEEVGDSAVEIVLLNGHDATVSYQFYAGLYRKVCSNGLIVSDHTFGSLKIRHSGNVLDDVIEGTYEVIKHAPEIQSKVDAWQKIAVNDGQRAALATAALQLRYDDAAKAPIQAEQLLRPHRYGDRERNLWVTYNVIQENLLKGGVPGRTANGGRTRTRQVNSVKEDVRLNRALWTLTEELAKAA